MTTDYIQDRQTRAHIGLFGHKPSPVEERDTGLELTRMQNFLDGRQDIFDILENVAANSDDHDLHSPAPAPMAPSHDDDTSLTDTLLGDIKDLSGAIVSRFSKLRKGLHKDILPS